VVQEGGMSSIVYAHHRRGEPKVELAVDIADVTYELCVRHLEVVAGRRGHREPTVTLRVYAHALRRCDPPAITLGAVLAAPGSAD
jgi:hypothetical protein